MKGAVVAFLLLISAALAFAAPPPGNSAADVCNQYTPTYIDVSVADSSDTSVTLALKIFTLDGTTYKYFDDAGNKLPPNSPDFPDNFYVYKGLKSADALLLDPGDLNGDLKAQASVGNVGVGNPSYNSQEARITLDRPPVDDCFITIIYWGHVETDAGGNPVAAGSYSPTFKTLPVCQTGAPSLATAGVTSSTLCLPLVLLLGLLAAAMYVQGKNPLAAFDFSSPRVTGGRPYTMRKGGQVNSFGYLLFNVGNYVGGGVTPVIGQPRMGPLGTMMGGTGGGQASGQKGSKLNPSGRDVGKGAGGTLMGAVGEFTSLPMDIKNAFSRPKLTVDAMGGEEKLKAAVDAGRQALISGLPGGMIWGRFLTQGRSSAGSSGSPGSAGGSAAKDTGKMQTLQKEVDDLKQKQNTATASQRESLQNQIDRRTSQMDVIRQKNYDYGTKMVAGINQAYTVFIGSMDALDRTYADKTDKSYLAKREALVDKFNIDTLRLRQGLEQAMGYSAQSLRMTQAIARDPILKVEFGNVLANIQKTEDALVKLPQTATAAERSEMIWNKEALVQQAFLIQEIARQNERNPEARTTVEQMAKAVNAMQGARPENPAGWAKYYFGDLVRADGTVNEEAVKMLIKDPRGACLVGMLNANYAASVSGLANEAVKVGNVSNIQAIDAMLAAAGNISTSASMLYNEQNRPKEVASQYVREEAAVQVAIGAAAVANKALVNPKTAGYAMQLGDAVGQHLKTLGELVSFSHAPGTSANIDALHSDFVNMQNKMDGSGAEALRLVQEHGPALTALIVSADSTKRQIVSVNLAAPLINYANNPEVAGKEVEQKGPTARFTPRAYENPNLEVAGKNFDLRGMPPEEQTKYLALLKEMHGTGADLEIRLGHSVDEMRQRFQAHGKKLSSTEMEKLELAQLDSVRNLEASLMAELKQYGLEQKVLGQKPKDVVANIDELNESIKKQKRGGYVTA